MKKRLAAWLRSLAATLDPPRPAREQAREQVVYSAALHGWLTPEQARQQFQTPYRKRS